MHPSHFQLIAYENVFDFSYSVTFGMTSSKTYYFTTVLRTIFTEQKVEGPGDQPAFNDIATFDDFWGVRSEWSVAFPSYAHYFPF